MGYSHYWNFDSGFTNREWLFAKVGMRHIFRECADILCEEFDYPTSDPVCNAGEIRFNGCGEEGYETFYVGRNEPRRNFCKTNLKPYDIAVVATLVLLAKIKEDFSWSSDGDENQTRDGIQLAATAYGLAVEGIGGKPFEDRPMGDPQIT